MSKELAAVLNVIFVAALTGANACAGVIMFADGNMMPCIPLAGFIAGVAFLVEVVRSFTGRDNGPITFC